MPDAFMPDVMVEVAFNAGYTTAATARRWTDVSSYVELGDGIDIGFGRQDERSDADANDLTLTLDNTDGRFTAGRSSSPYYPNVKVGRPIRVSAVMPGTASLVTNPGAEVNVTGWSGFGSTTAVSRSTTRAKSGSASFLCTWGNAAAEASTVFCSQTGLTVGEWYLFEADVWVPASQPRMILKCREFKSLPSTTNGAWEHLQVIFQAAATSHSIEVKHFDAATAGQTGYFDDASVKLTQVRFVGFVDQWPVEWDGSDRYAKAQIRAASRLSRLGLNAKLRSPIETEILLPQPTAYWTLGDPSGSTQAAESSGAGLVGPLIQGPDVTSSPGVGTFGNAIGVASDGLTAMYLPADSTRLAATIPAGPAATVRSVRLCFISDAPKTSVAFMLDVDGLSGAGTSLNLYHNGSGEAQPYAVGGGTFSGGSWPLEAGSAAPGALHDLVYTSSVADGAKLYLDGVLVDTAAGVDHVNMWRFRLGRDGALSGYTFCHVAIYDTILTAAQVAAQATAALTGFAGDRTDQRIVRALGWVGVPSSEATVEAGVETMTYQLTSGMNAVDVMREAESTEGGVLFDGRDGNVWFHNRSHRYTRTASVTLNMASQHVGADYVPRVDRSALINDIEIENPTTEEKVRVYDADSQDEYGIATATLTSLASASGFRSRGDWVLSSYAEPQTRVPSLTVDVLAHQGLTPSAQALLALTMGDLLAVTNAPSQSSTTTPSYFVEGYSERIGPESWEITFNLSPSTPTGESMLLDSATRGLADTHRAAY